MPGIQTAPATLPSVGRTPGCGRDVGQRGDEQQGRERDQRRRQGHRGKAAGGIERGAEWRAER
jgi:hypothetical protein